MQADADLRIVAGLPDGDAVADATTVADTDVRGCGVADPAKADSYRASDQYAVDDCHADQSVVATADADGSDVAAGAAGARGMMEEGPGYFTSSTFPGAAWESITVPLDSGTVPLDSGTLSNIHDIEPGVMEKRITQLEDALLAVVGRLAVLERWREAIDGESSTPEV